MVAASSARQLQRHSSLVPVKRRPRMRTDGTLTAPSALHHVATLSRADDGPSIRPNASRIVRGLGGSRKPGRLEELDSEPPAVAVRGPPDDPAPEEGVAARADVDPQRTLLSGGDRRVDADAEPGRAQVHELPAGDHGLEDFDGRVVDTPADAPPRPQHVPLSHRHHHANDEASAVPGSRFPA
jgi:hypothetical protein